MEDRICSLMEKFVDIVENQMSGDISKICTHELGEVVDMFKDCAEAKMYIAKAEYYENMEDKTVTTK